VDGQEAVRWYRAAADKGLVAAELSLGMMYLHGTAVTQDAKRGLIWLRKAASHGSAAAQSEIALIAKSEEGGSGDSQVTRGITRGDLNSSFSFASIPIE
jgi:hypothetical protein